MSNAADGHLGDWLPHKDNCRCEDCSLERAQRRIAALQRKLETAVEALKRVKSHCLLACEPLARDNDNMVVQDHRVFDAIFTVDAAISAAEEREG